MEEKPGRVPQAKRTRFFQKESPIMPGHLAPGHQRFCSQMDIVMLTEQLKMIKRLPARKTLAGECK